MNPIVATILMFLTGCVPLHSSYKPDPLPVPEAFQQAQGVPSSEPSGTARIADDPWWTQFGDAQLNELIELALTHNDDLAKAAIDVRRAQLRAGLVGVNPTVGFDANIGREQRWPGGEGIAGRQALNFRVAYEVDLWGKLAQQRNSAQWDVLATIEGHESAALALIGRVAELYWRLAYQAQDRRVTEDSVAYLTKILDLVRQQHEAGAVSALDVLTAEEALARQRMTQAQRRQTTIETRADLALLFVGTGSPEQSQVLMERLQTLVPQLPASATLPVINPGIPAELLRSRPDLRAAEQRLRKMVAEDDVLRAGFYPVLSLTGAFGTSSDALRDFLKNPVGSLAANFALPLTQWHRRRDVDISQADYEKALIDFRQTFYKALRDVDVALSLRRQLMTDYEKLMQILKSTRQKLRLAEERYRAGAEPLRVWLDAQEALRAAELATAEGRVQLMMAQVRLYQALGTSKTT